MRQTICLASLAAAMAHCGPASASDLNPVPFGKPTVPIVGTMPLPMSSWTGFYVGAFAGYARDKLTTSSKSGATTSPNLSLSTVPVGGFFGYNTQYGQLVTGVEGEAGVDLSGKKSTNFQVLSSPGTGTLQAKDTVNGRLRLRAGYEVAPQFLLFAAGGYSIDSEKLTSSGVTATAYTAANTSKTLQGYNFGLGADYAWSHNWLVRVEYLHDVFSKKDYALGPDLRRVGLTKDTVRGAVAYRF